MKNIIFAIFAVCILSPSAVFARDHHDAARDLGYAAGNFIFDVLTGGRNHHHHGYREYRYNEIEEARRQGFEEARRRDLEERRWKQEEIKRQRLESARIQGEIMYYNGYRRY